MHNFTADTHETNDNALITDNLKWQSQNFTYASLVCRATLVLVSSDVQVLLELTWLYIGPCAKLQNDLMLL